MFLQLYTSQIESASRNKKKNRKDKNLKKRRREENRPGVMTCFNQQLLCDLIEWAHLGDDVVFALLH